MGTFEDERNAMEVRMEVRMRLQEIFGAVRGRHISQRLLEVARDGRWSPDLPDSTRRRYVAQLASVGIHSLNMGDALAALKEYNDNR